MDSPQFLVHNVEVAHKLKAKDDIRNSPSPVVFLSGGMDGLGPFNLRINTVKENYP